MQNIRNLYAAAQRASRPVISYELFTPKTAEGERLLFDRTIPALQSFAPDYCSVTYGAGGTTRDKTLSIVDRIQREIGLTAMAHLTCVGSSRDQIEGIIQQARQLGIHNILALRGDPPTGETAFHAVEGGFTYAYELVALLKAAGGLCIGVAGFPEGHIACTAGKLTDWNHLLHKIQIGADFVLTQLFFDNQDYYDFRDYLTKRGVAVPICPGIIPILSGHQIKKFTALCGARLPTKLLARLADFGDDDRATTEFGIEYATEQCADLLRAGVPGLHFYALNKSYSVGRILENLGIRGRNPPGANQAKP